MHDGVKVTKDQRKKPNVHAMYDHRKGEVLMLLIYCRHLIQLASNTNDSL